MKKITALVYFIYLFANACFAQNIVEIDSVANDSLMRGKFSYKQVIIPVALIGYGFWGMESGQIKSFNTQIRDKVTENIDHKTTIDDFSKWAPAVSVYALNGFGIEGRNNLKDRSVILATSYLMTTGIVFGLKSVTNIERPDATTNDSFPSGHTAIAFAGAEFLWQEYKDKSIWYGIAGYAVATGTGLFRMYNNRHWLTDVAAGAGIGILSTKVAYLLHPFLNRTIFGSKETKSTSMIAPSYDGTHLGICYVKSF